MTPPAGLQQLTQYGQALIDMAHAGTLQTYLEKLSDRSRRTCEYALAAVGAGWRANPTQQFHHLNPDATRYRYIALLGAAFRRLADGIEPHQDWWVPTRHGKSTIGSRHGPTWLLDRDPYANLIMVSYAQQLALEHAGEIRDLIRTNPNLFRVRLRRDSNRKDRFRTFEGGGMLAAGIDGGLTGFAAGGGIIGAGGGIIMDDLYKNWADAHSSAYRERVRNVYKTVILTRLNDERAFTLHVSTRWHRDDLAATRVAMTEDGTGKPVAVTRLTPFCTDPDTDPLGRALGETLGRFPPDEYMARRRALGAYLAAALEDQEPTMEEGGELKRAWWRFGAQPASQPDMAVTSWDMKLKDTAAGDYVVGQTWFRYASTAWCVAQLRGQWSFATVRAAIALAQVRHPQVSRHLIENTGNGPEVIAYLRQAHPDYTTPADIAGQLAMNTTERQQVDALIRRGVTGLIPVNPKGDKLSRARAASGWLEAGDIWIVDHAVNTFGVDLVNEAAAFPNGDHDDQVDAWSQAVRYLLAAPVTPATTRRPQASARLPTTRN